MKVSDLFFSVVLLLLALPIFLLSLCISAMTFGSAIYVQQRVGKDGRLFYLYKIRSLPMTTISVPTHDLLEEGNKWSKFIRGCKLDELPQLVNVAKGDMAIIGPRPCLPQQLTLIQERRMSGVNHLLPGITGVPQVLGIDMSDPSLLSRVESTCFGELDLTKKALILVATLKLIPRSVIIKKFELEKIL